MIEPTDLDWLALCLVTESNRPEEWPYIAQVIENRRSSGRWGKTFRDVVLARKQFSGFNGVSGRLKGSASSVQLPDLEAWNIVAIRMSTLLLMRAAASIGVGPRPSEQDRVFSFKISPETLHYFSPVSMVPAGSKPPWAKDAKRLYTPPGVDEERFVFAESVP